MNAYRRFLWIFLLIVPVLWLAWPSNDKAGREEGPEAGLAAKKHQLADGKVETGPRIGPRRDRGEGVPANLASVDRVLANDGISNEQAALRLCDIASNPSNPVEERLEALQHGLNLHTETFADFAQQKDLPSELASHFLHEIINHDEAPAIQIRSYMALMDHPDAEVADLAKEMLALEVGDEDRLSTREKLLVVGKGKLAKLASENGK